MRGFLTKIIDRRLRRLTAASTIGLAVVATVGITTGNFHDPKFDDAQIAVAKAQLLLDPSTCRAAGSRAAESCEKLVRRAEDLLTKAREAVAAAATAADGGDVVLPAKPTR